MIIREGDQCKFDEYYFKRPMCTGCGENRIWVHNGSFDSKTGRKTLVAMCPNNRWWKLVFHMELFTDCTVTESSSDIIHKGGEKGQEWALVACGIRNTGSTDSTDQWGHVTCERCLGTKPA